ncbi:MAG: hypothetical protein ACRD1S_04960 [Vicinamibacterales bacterium]
MIMPLERDVADWGVFRPGHQVWQRANIMAAANYFREAVSRSPDDLRLKSLYEGLLEVLDPSRRTQRYQRELAFGATIARQERRRGSERRTGRDRRHTDVGPPGGIERRRGSDRRGIRDRRRR